MRTSGGTPAEHETRQSGTDGRRHGSAREVLFPVRSASRWISSAKTNRRLEHRYHIHTDDTAPHVYYRLTDNWIDLTVRFLVREHGVRVVKDRMSREIIEQFDAHKIGIASGTYDIVGLPPVTVRLTADTDRSKTPQ